MFDFLKKLFGGASEDAPSSTASSGRSAGGSRTAQAAGANPGKAPAAAYNARPNSKETGVPNPDGSTFGYRPNGELFFVHPFSVAITGEFLHDSFDEEALAWLPKPQPPAGFPADAYEYADKWLDLWERALEPQFEFYEQIDTNKSVPGAQDALERWEGVLRAIDTEATQLGDFKGARNLVLGNSDMHESVDTYIEVSRDYLAKRIDWDSLDQEDKQEIIYDCIGTLFGFYTRRNEILAGFYQDPSGQAARQAEEEAFAPLMAMRNVDTSAPELQPIAGVSLHDFVAGSQRLHANAPIEEITTILGIERPQWDQAAAEWQHRIGTHPMTVGVEYSNLMSQPHPLFSGAAGAGSSQTGQAGNNSARLSTDRNFYVEVAAAMGAAGEAGIDTDGYLHEHYGVSIAEAGAAGVTWMSDITQAGDLTTLIRSRQAEIAKEIAQLAGPGAADDIEF